jgi:hypothetical protein
MRLPGFSAEVSLSSLSPYNGIWGPAELATGVQPALSCIYGNWCGPGCSGPEDPVDDLDTCCQIHDNCYNARGWGACSCDRELMACVWPKINFLTAKGKAALGVWSYFAHGWCNPFT